MSLRSWLMALYMALVAGLGLLLAANYPDFYRNAKPPLFDAHAYWLAAQDGWIPYSLPPGALNAFLYSPAFIHAVSVLTWLPWPAFAMLWAALVISAFLWLLRPLGWAWMAVLLLWCIPEVYIGNIYAFLAVATVLAMTGHPQAWALPILTKPVLGIGVLWHAVNKEWRAIGISLLSTLGIVAVSLLIDPLLWANWIRFLLAAATDSADSFKWRVLAAGALICLAAVLRQKWLVPFGLLLALPVVGSISAFTILAAIPRLVVSQAHARVPQP